MDFEEEILKGESREAGRKFAHDETVLPYLKLIPGTTEITNRNFKTTLIFHVKGYLQYFNIPFLIYNEININGHYEELFFIVPLMVNNNILSKIQELCSASSITFVVEKQYYTNTQLETIYERMKRKNL